MNSNTWKLIGSLLLIILIIIGILNILPIIIILGVLLWLGITIWGYIKQKKYNNRKNSFKEDIKDEDYNVNNNIEIDKSKIVDVDYKDVNGGL